MDHEPRITDLLQKAKSGDRDATNAVVRRFWEMAKRVAYKRLSARARRLTSGSDIANAALRSALSYLGTPKGAKVSTGGEFGKLVYQILKRKCVDADRSAKALVRDERRREDLTTELAEGGKHQSDADLMAEELATRVIDFLMKEPDEQKLAVDLYGLACGYSTEEIRDILASDPKLKPRSERAVQKRLEETRKRLAGFLRRDYGELLRPKKTSKDGPKRVSSTKKSSGAKKALPRKDRKKRRDD